MSSTFFSSLTQQVKCLPDTELSKPLVLTVRNSFRNIFNFDSRRVSERVCLTLRAVINFDCQGHQYQCTCAIIQTFWPILHFINYQCATVCFVHFFFFLKWNSATIRNGVTKESCSGQGWRLQVRHHQEPSTWDIAADISMFGCAFHYECKEGVNNVGECFFVPLHAKADGFWTPAAGEKKRTVFEPISIPGSNSEGAKHLQWNIAVVASQFHWE